MQPKLTKSIYFLIVLFLLISTVGIGSAAVKDLKPTAIESTSIMWTWTNPTSADFSHVMIYLNGKFIANTTKSRDYYVATGLTEGTKYTISTKTVDNSGKIDNTWANSSTKTTNTGKTDTTPPASVEELKNSAVGQTWITWTWTKPADTDFKNVAVYIDGKFVTDTSEEFYNATGFTQGTTHTISTKTVDTSGNVNPAWINSSATTNTGQTDTIPPASVTNLKDSAVGSTWITWTWTKPADTDFKHVTVYIDGKFVTDTSEESYNATGFAQGTTHTISTKTVDTSGNVNPAWINSSATTNTDQTDTIPPASVTNLKDSAVGPTWITWTWTKPADTDFKHVTVYIDGKFVTDTPEEFYNATGFTQGTTHTISTKTVDTSGNVNPAWVNSSATTNTGQADTIPPASVTNLKGSAVGSTWITWTWTKPADTDFKHVTVYIDGKFATNTSQEFYNATGFAKGTTHTISTKTVDTSGNVNPVWVNSSATTATADNLPIISGLSGKDITTTSITLIWEASNDTNTIQISRNNVSLANVNASTFYIDNNLTSSTTYNYTLVPYSAKGIEGNQVSINLKTRSSGSSGSGGGGSSTSSSGSSNSKSSSSGGGGGGAGSVEDFANVAMKDSDSEYLRMNSNVTYYFTKEGNDILSVSFYSLKNSGEITSTIEVLNNRSKLVNSTPDGPAI